MNCKPIYLHYSCSLKQKRNNETESRDAYDDLTVDMETVEDGVRSMDIVNTAAIVTTMAQLYLIYHQLAIILPGLSRLYLLITINITNDMLGSVCHLLT